MCASVCRKYGFEGYCPKPQGGTNNVLQYMCKAEPLCAENIGLKDIARSCRGELISRGELMMYYKAWIIAGADLEGMI